MNWKKTTIIVLDVLVGIYLVLAITAFNKPDKESDICRNVHISIEQDFAEGFLNENSIRAMLRQSGLTLIAQPMANINTRQIEEILQGNELIDKAECYKAIDGVLCIKIRQRVPVIRVMADNGDDYYVDNRGEAIPHHKYTCNLIVATGHISKKYASKILTPIANSVRDDDFWKNQIVQLNVLSDGSMELIPRVGDHIAYLGQPTNVEKKLDRLRKFYLYGLNEAGWNRYSRISVEFDNQIICKKRKLKKL
ncbi:MAG: cell division protein FtsQ [Prevotella sp.]|nr:cell division protein FtsQ [Prevotella sp.]